MQFYWFISKVVIYFLGTLRWVFDEVYLQHVRLRGRRTKDEITKSSHLCLWFSLLLIVFLLLRDFYSYYYCLIKRTVSIFFDFDFLWFSFYRQEKIKRRNGLLQHPQRTLFVWHLICREDLEFGHFFIVYTFVYFYFFLYFLHFYLSREFGHFFIVCTFVYFYFFIL